MPTRISRVKPVYWSNSSSQATPRSDQSSRLVTTGNIGEDYSLKVSINIREPDLSVIGRM